MKLLDLSLVLVYTYSHAQQIETSNYILEPIKQSYTLVFHNNKNGRQLELHEGKHIKTYFLSPKGKWRYRRGTLTSITAYKLTCVPANHRFQTVVYDTDIMHGEIPLDKISFTSGRSITKGILFHAAVGGFFYLITVSPAVALGAVVVAVVGEEWSRIYQFVDSISPSHRPRHHYPGSFREHIDLRRNKWRMDIIENLD